jgi:superfamily II DNA helicase RecQ
MVKAVAYHAGMDNDIENGTNNFMSVKPRVVATNAFGMV